MYSLCVVPAEGVIEGHGRHNLKMFKFSAAPLSTRTTKVCELFLLKNVAVQLIR